MRVIAFSPTTGKVTTKTSNEPTYPLASAVWSFRSIYGDEIEIVLANNDDMALGAIDALKAAGISAKDENWPTILGIDGTTVGLEAVEKGEMLGTVLNNYKGQARGILELAWALKNDTEVPEEFELQEGKYIRLPYKAVTKENLMQIQMEMMN